MTTNYGLIFDVDGVIADTEAVNAKATARVFKDFFAIEDVRREDFEAGLGRGAEAYVQVAARVHGMELTPDQLATAVQMRQDYFLALLMEEPLPPFPGVLELMQSSFQHGYVRLAIATSSTRQKSLAVLESARIPYREMVYVSGEEVRRKKPDPELFLTAAMKMSLPTSRCLVIEDAPDGVESALASGCTCIAVTNSTSAERLSRADRIVQSLMEVKLEDIFSIIDGKGGHFREKKETVPA